MSLTDALAKLRWAADNGEFSAMVTPEECRALLERLGEVDIPQNGDGGAENVEVVSPAMDTFTVALLANVKPGTLPDEWPWVYTVIAPDGDVVYSSGPPKPCDPEVEMLALGEFILDLEASQ